MLFQDIGSSVIPLANLNSFDCLIAKGTPESYRS